MQLIGFIPGTPHTFMLCDI